MDYDAQEVWLWFAYIRLQEADWMWIIDKDWMWLIEKDWVSH
jgi:hypothetical protein